MTDLLSPRWEGKHLPDSHPLVTAMRESTRTTLPDSVQAVEEITARLDTIAITLEGLPDRPLSVSQRRLAELLGHELLRRAAR